MSEQFEHVIYVAGNHEHYHGIWDQTIDILTEEIKRYPNIHFLEQNSVIINDVVFLGATLWTDMNNMDPFTLMDIRNQLNDYVVVADFANGKWNKLSPLTTAKKHKDTIDWLRSKLSEDLRKTVVVTHHTPSFKSISEQYRSAWHTNGAYASDLSVLILEHPHIALWTSGHVHHSHRYYIGDTLCISNTHGYPGERTGFDSNKIVDLNSMPTHQEVENDYHWKNF